MKGRSELGPGLLGSACGQILLLLFPPGEAATPLDLPPRDSSCLHPCPLQQLILQVSSAPSMWILQHGSTWVLLHLGASSVVVKRFCSTLVQQIVVVLSLLPKAVLPTFKSQGATKRLIQTPALLLLALFDICLPTFFTQLLS